jgi:hypothetical protein
VTFWKITRLNIGGAPLWKCTTATRSEALGVTHGRQAWLTLQKSLSGADLSAKASVTKLAAFAVYKNR